MLDDHDNMIPVESPLHRRSSPADPELGLVAPFELVCLPCSSQGVRVVIPPGGSCSRCQHVAALNRRSDLPPAGAVPTVFPSARPEREPVGCWCLGGLGGKTVYAYGLPPSWLHQVVRRRLFGDIYLEAG